MERKADHRVICFGEVLWDILPSGAVPGGAPMNVAFHLHKLGKNPALITRIGIDEEGKTLVNLFSEKGICIDYFQWDEMHETGKVFAFPNVNHEMVYDIVKPVAWDFIQWKETYPIIVKRADYFVFGSLSARSEVSRKTLMELIHVATNKVLDINLRPPHYDRPTVEELCSKTDFLKLNLGELELISDWYGAQPGIEERSKTVSERFSIPNIVVTMGSDGAFFLSDGKIYMHKGFQVEVKDTVGSGDAFLAGLLSRLMDKEDPGKALEFANALGALVATRTGACPEYELEEVSEMIKNSVQRTY